MAPKNLTKSCYFARKCQECDQGSPTLALCISGTIGPTEFIQVANLWLFQGLSNGMTKRRCRESPSKVVTLWEIVGKWSNEPDLDSAYLGSGYTLHSSG